VALVDTCVWPMCKLVTLLSVGLGDHESHHFFLVKQQVKNRSTEVRFCLWI